MTRCSNDNEEFDVLLQILISSYVAMSAHAADCVDSEQGVSHLGKVSDPRLSDLFCVDPASFYVYQNQKDGLILRWARRDESHYLYYHLISNGQG